MSHKTKHLNFDSNALGEAMLASQPADFDEGARSLDLKISKSEYRYPRKKNSKFDYGVSVLNADGAGFDSFIYFETVDEKPLLIVLQMKFSLPNSQKVINDKVITDEYKKIEKKVQKNLSGIDFVAVIIGNCKGEFTEENIPKNCIVISNSELVKFYGEYYYNRLNYSMYRDFQVND